MSHDLLDETCPVPLDLLGAVYRADDEQLDTILAGLSAANRAKLAAYLYGRSHTHALGLKIAANCDGASLRRAAGLAGNALYEQSRNPSASPLRAGASAAARRGISLGGRAAGMQTGAF